MTGPGRRPARLLPGAVALLALAWLTAPDRSTPPLYDGVAFPDEPYRYVAAPPGAPATSPPGTAVRDALVRDGMSRLTYGGSEEQGPQVQIVVNDGDITAPAGATVVHLRAAPLAPTSQPLDAKIWGNVYRLTAVSDAGPAQFATHPSPVTAIILRAPVGPAPEPVMEYSDGTAWRRLPMTRVGNDVYSTHIVGTGDYAVATLPGQTQPVPGPGTTTDGGGGIDRWVLLPGIALLVLIGAIAAVRWTRSTYRRAAADLIDTHALAGYARTVTATAADIDLPPDQHTILQRTAQQLLDEASASIPDPRQLRQLAEHLLTLLRTATPTASSGTAITLGEQAVRDLHT